MMKEEGFGDKLRRERERERGGERYMYSEAVDDTSKEIDLPTKLRRSDIYRNLG